MPSIVFDSAAVDQPWSATYSAGQTPIVGGRANAIETLQAIEKQAASRRFAGFLNYDLGGCFETLPTRATDDLSLPFVYFLPCTRRPAGTPIRAADMQIAKAGRPVANFTRAQYESAVEKCLAYISAGDVFQINLSQRFAVPWAGDASRLYARLQNTFSARYGAYLDTGDCQIISNSPEQFIRVHELPDGRRRIVNRPIKGTRPFEPGMLDKLEQSEKDKAELAMIVDLQRNDLGRICEIGTVKVTDRRSLEVHPTVIHGVATIEGILRPDVTLVDILRATFPCGSVTGCPKIRAMQIIDELEPVRRGVYCGAIGWIQGREMEFAVAIRTMTVKNGTVYIPVGGGIVTDSNPAAEYGETLVKARAMFSALGV